MCKCQLSKKIQQKPRTVREVNSAFEDLDKIGCKAAAQIEDFLNKSLKFDTLKVDNFFEYFPVDINVRVVKKVLKSGYFLTWGEEKFLLQI